MDAAITAAIERLADAGFDLVHPFDAAAAAREPGWEHLVGVSGSPDTRSSTRRMSETSDTQRSRLGLLIGNTRALWPRFVAAMRDPDLAAEADPLDRYTERTIEAAFSIAHDHHDRHALDRINRAPILYAHREYPGGFLPFTRLAVATGLGALASSHLVIHPIYGPWFALRAVVLLDGEGPVRVPLAAPCTCAAACGTALEAALPTTSWQAWLAVRDACSLRAWRYSDEQIRYHYTKEWIPPVETP